MFFFTKTIGSLFPNIFFFGFFEEIVLFYFLIFDDQCDMWKSRTLAKKGRKTTRDTIERPDVFIFVCYLRVMMQRYVKNKPSRPPKLQRPASHRNGTKRPGHHQIYDTTFIQILLFCVYLCVCVCVCVCRSCIVYNFNGFVIAVSTHRWRGAREYHLDCAVENPFFYYLFISSSSGIRRVGFGYQ